MWSNNYYCFTQNTIIMDSKKTEGQYVCSLFPDYEVQEPQVQKPQKTKKELAEEIQRLKGELAEKQREIEQLTKEKEQLRKKANAYDSFVSAESYFPITVIAKSLDMSAISLNQYLRKKGVQYCRGDVWMLYQRYVGKGYTRTMWYEYKNDRSRAHMYWTPKGMMFIRELLKQDGLLKD